MAGARHINLVVLSLILGFLGILPPAAGARDIPAAGPSVSIRLLPDVRAGLDATGALWVDTRGSRHLLMNLSGDQEPVAPFLVQTSEGASNGLRGFSGGADDDGDGSTDEDRRDGRDNDGDGRIDEDFAAIGDHMLVWDDSPAGSPVHAEVYHWNTDFLRPAMFLSLAGFANQVLLSNLPWIPVDLQAPDTGGNLRKAAAWVTILRDEAGQDIWLGARSLDGGVLTPAGLGRLQVPDTDKVSVLALVVARTWVGLSSRMCQAETLRDGVADPLTGRRLGWVPSPPDPALNNVQSWTWRATPDGGGELSRSLVPGDRRLPDPAFLAIDGHPMPEPEAVVLEQGGIRAEMPGPAPFTYQDLLRGHPAPSAVAKPLEAGDRVVLVYDRIPGIMRHRDVGSVAALDGRGQDGHRLAGGVTVLEPGRAAATREQDKSLSGLGPPDLDPELMLGWPNPFSDRCQIRCRIPATAEEAFTASDPEEDREGVRATLELPWEGSEPSVSVRIYNLNGQELRTLFTGRRGAGEFVVQWDGADNFGRPVASGPYLCKFQLDGMSLTRRLVYLR